MQVIKAENRCVGKIKPMHAVNNAPIDITFGGNFSLLSDANIPYARLHDTGGHYGSYVFVDIDNIFRDFDADPKNPESYDFAFTDYLVNKLSESGCMPFYRLGASIEINHKIRAYRIYPPRDYKKWAEICEGIINHYTKGFADGYFYPIEYWEIWNEPDNEPNPLDSPMWRGSMEEYFELYSVAAKYLKDKFPNIKINVVAVKNNFFGGGVNVSGLVTGGDLIEQLRGRELGERLFIPSSMLRFENDVFLDDVSVEDVERELGISLEAVNNNGDQLVRAVTSVKE